MKVQRQSLDRISGLPQDAIEKILTLMPIRDALRTSILSKNWRGPISELWICSDDTEIVNELDQIMLHLSWRKNIKKFIFQISLFRGDYKLPCSFFSWQGLEYLNLTYCAFEPPLMFNGFSMLKCLVFYEVRITINILQRFLINCPVLEEFTLNGHFEEEFIGDKCTIVELFKCLPSVQVVEITGYYMKPLAACGIPQKLPTSLVHLRILVLAMCFQSQDGLSSILCVINSSPNLEKIKMTMFPHVGETITTFHDLQDYSGLNLDHLKELEITSFHNYASEMEFVKLIMAKSPVLKKARIELNFDVSVDEEVKMLRDLVRLPFLRASPSANFIIERPKKLRVNEN
ncbi:hypothetical protein L2E82_13937 [Cichorium intybus]|uniref:Uncharacterized protein n=1 Tax=Cichorium intybus TaxID=13427 RepID=A0ACB9EYL5_CICIN|nr:hypothetical protein L2E82_13937 [Cichorium intybus]